MIFVTSDTHFWHKNIIQYSSRPFKDVVEMNETIIRNWNDTVKPEDTVYHLGDFAFSNYDKALDIAKRLNGKKYLIKGNHDTKMVESIAFASRFVKVVDYLSDTFTVDGKSHKVVMSHFPMEVWDKAHFGSIHLHGHCHGTLRRKVARRFDVGVDPMGMNVVSMKRIFDMAENEVFVPSDHHGDRELSESMKRKDG